MRTFMRNDNVNYIIMFNGTEYDTSKSLDQYL